MGGCNSICIGKRSHNASAVFTNINSFFQRGDLVDINAATAEELMTLPGIDRTIAGNILLYRRQIRGFKRIEDLALVPGIGGDKLLAMQHEICVKNRRPSRVGKIIVSLNSSSVFQLMKVPEINQRIGEAIVSYRDKHGDFTSIDSLIKVKGIDAAVLSRIKPHLVLNSADIPRLSATEEEDSGASVDSDSLPTYNGDTSDWRKLVGYPNDSRLNDYFTSSQIDLLVELNPFQSVKRKADTLSRPSLPDVDVFYFTRWERKALRIGTWNLCRLTAAKAQNPGVREVFCSTILEQGISLLTIQEVAEPKALQILCNELNRPTLPNVKRWRGPRGTWSFIISPVTGRMFRSPEYIAFLYDSEVGFKPGTCNLLEKPSNNSDKSFARSPYMGNFQVDNAHFLLVSAHLKACGLVNQDIDRTTKEVQELQHLAEAIDQTVSNNIATVIAGDFNLNPDHEAFQCLRQQGYTNLLPGNQSTNVSQDNLDGSRSYDNIWISESTQPRFTGYTKIVRSGLNHPLIPQDSFEWNGMISDHCPVWAEFFTDN